MATKLTRPSDERTRPKRNFDLGKGGNRNFDLDKGGKRHFDLSKDDLQENVAPQSIDTVNQSAEAEKSAVQNSSESTQQIEAPKENGSGKKVVIWLIVSLLIIAAAIFFFMRSCNQSKDEALAEEAVEATSAQTEDEGANAVTDTLGNIPGGAVEAENAEETTAEVAVEEAGKTMADGQNERRSASAAAPTASSAGNEASAPVGDDDLNTVVNATIRGDYGNGEARKSALGNRYRQVQSEVNRRLLK